GMRTWCCTVCGSVHDRDVNAAKNILLAGMLSRVTGPMVLRDAPLDTSFAAGRGRLAEGILAI
ncbi:TPA: transposase, partial [Burkholderia vietnamiensis]|nr:transposase [Burkholderia vietnamiensis]